MIPGEAKQTTSGMLEDLPRGSYVYFIVRDGDCVYVGQTTNLRQRLRSHPVYRKRDQAFFIHVDDSIRLSVEKEWIAQLNPEFNGRPGRPLSGPETLSVRFEMRLTVAEHKKLIRLGGAKWVREIIREDQGKKSYLTKRVHHERSETNKHARDA